MWTADSPPCWRGQDRAGLIEDGRNQLLPIRLALDLLFNYSSRAIRIAPIERLVCVSWGRRLHWSACSTPVFPYMA